MFYCLTPTKEDFIRAVEIFERLGIPHCSRRRNLDYLFDYAGSLPYGIEIEDISAWQRLSRGRVMLLQDRPEYPQVPLDLLEAYLKLLLL